MPEAAVEAESSTQWSPPEFFNFVAQKLVPSPPEEREALHIGWLWHHEIRVPKKPRWLRTPFYTVEEHEAEFRGAEDVK